MGHVITPMDSDKFLPFATVQLEEIPELGGKSLSCAKALSLKVFGTVTEGSRVQMSHFETDSVLTFSLIETFESLWKTEAE